MAYAVTCKSCGARFSVASDLVQKRIGLEAVALRCKRCREPILVRASQPPEALKPPTPHARPRPPLKKQPVNVEPKSVEPKSPEAANAARRGLPPRPKARAGSLVALGRGLLPERADLSEDLFDAPPPSNRGAVDLSEMAHSEPPPGNGNSSSAPPLFELSHTGAVKAETVAHDDVDFFLGLRGSPGTTAALQSPSFDDLLRKPESERPLPITFEESPTETPTPVALPKAPMRATSTLSASPRPEPRRRKGVAATLAFAALGISGVVLAASALSHRTTPEVSASDPAVSTATSPPNEDSPQPPLEPPPEASVVEPVVPSSKPARALSRAPRADSKPVTPSSTPPSEPARQVSALRPAVRSEPREPVGAGFDRAAAVSTLATQAGQASKCRKDGDPSGTANITITFAPSGRVTSANLSGPPFAGTPTGGCIAAALRRARVPAFDGDNVTVSKTVVIQ